MQGLANQITYRDSYSNSVNISAFKSRNVFESKREMVMSLRYDDKRIPVGTKLVGHQKRKRDGEIKPLKTKHICFM
jgi:hypothetical protein